MTEFEIYLSENMQGQGLKRPLATFKKFEKAYEFGASIFGSGTYRIFYSGRPQGWEIISIDAKKFWNDLTLDQRDQLFISRNYPESPDEFLCDCEDHNIIYEKLDDWHKQI